MTTAADNRRLSEMSRGDMTGIAGGGQVYETLVWQLEDVTMQCIDLKARFGDRYRVDFEEPAKSRATDPWVLTIPCQHGHVYAHGGDDLGFASNKRGAITKQVAELPFVAVTQDGDDGSNIVFDVSHFNKVARIVKPKRRRRLSKEQRIKAVRNLVPFTVADASENDLERAQTYEARKMP